MSRKERLELIQAIEESRTSKLITYITGDRQGVEGQIASDAVRPMYEHLKPFGFSGVSKIDLFLYSQGGAVDVPWRLITMLREHSEELNVLVPYKAHSAATLISLGADRIVMGKKGELGPIDPILTRIEEGRRETINIEDVMAFVAFLKERAGLGDQTALANSVGILINQLPAWVIGSIYRTHSHIRLIARKLLTSHKNPLEERQINLIVETLAEKIYSHGHAIGRGEALDIGLPVEKAEEKLESQMWQLLEAYENAMQLYKPIDPKNIIPPGQDEYQEPITLAAIESVTRLDVCQGTLKFKHIRQSPPQLNLNINLQIPLSPEVMEGLTDEAKKRLQTLLQELQGQIAGMVQNELKNQSPIQRTEGGLSGAYWKSITDDSF